MRESTQLDRGKVVDSENNPEAVAQQRQIALNYPQDCKDKELHDLYIA